MLVFFSELCAVVIASMSAESSFVESIRSHLADLPSFDRFYRRVLHDVHRHRAIDTVASPIDVRRILSNEYDDGYLNISVRSIASKQQTFGRQLLYLSLGSAMKPLPIFSSLTVTTKVT